MNKYTRIIICTIACLSVGYFSKDVTQNGLFWYSLLKKPFFNPPSWIFAPVWTFLYIIIGIAAGLIWNEIKTPKAPLEEIKKSISFFMVQLFLNLAWSFLFFGLKNIMLAAIEMALLWLFIYETYLLFIKIKPQAGYLLIPYLFWVTFALILNLCIWYLNN